MVAAYHPSPKPHVPRSVGARADGHGWVWAGLGSVWGISDLYQTPRNAISVFLGPASNLLLQDSRRRWAHAALPERHGEVGGVLISILCWSGVSLCTESGRGRVYFEQEAILT